MTVSSHDVREQAAKAAFDHLGSHPSEFARLQVSCGRSHHVAAVYDTDLGAVFRSVTHASSHGKRDRVDTGHSGHAVGRTWFDILNPAEDDVDDAMPAGCECGPYTLSRDLLIRQIAAGERHLIID